MSLERIQCCCCWRHCRRCCPPPPCRRALLEADVSLPVVRRFVARVEEAALGERVVKGLSPDQKLVKVRRRWAGGCSGADGGGPAAKKSFAGASTVLRGWWMQPQGSTHAAMCMMWHAQRTTGRPHHPPPPTTGCIACISCISCTSWVQVVYEELRLLMGGEQAELVQPKYGPAVSGVMRG